MDGVIKEFLKSTLAADVSHTVKPASTGVENLTVKKS
jgi:hypothetical protein